MLSQIQGATFITLGTMKQSRKGARNRSSLRETFGCRRRVENIVNRSGMNAPVLASQNHRGLWAARSQPICHATNFEDCMPELCASHKDSGAATSNANTKNTSQFRHCDLKMSARHAPTATMTMKLCAWIRGSSPAKNPAAAMCNRLLVADGRNGASCGAAPAD